MRFSETTHENIENIHFGQFPCSVCYFRRCIIIHDQDDKLYKSHTINGQDVR